MRKFPAFIESLKAKSVRASGGDPLTRDSAPGLCWGLCPQTPVIGSLSTRSPWPPLCQILNTPLYVNVYIFIIALPK